jgi:hypothetical protein
MRVEANDNDTYLIVFGVVVVDSEKMTFLEMFDMYLIIFVIFSQY